MGTAAALILCSWIYWGCIFFSCRERIPGRVVGERRGCARGRFFPNFIILICDSDNMKLTSTIIDISGILGTTAVCCFMRRISDCNAMTHDGMNRDFTPIT